MTILAEQLSPHLTSNVAAGIFLWSIKAPDEATNREWADDSWQWFSQLLKDAQPWKTGVSKLPAYVFSSHGKEKVERPLMKELSPVYRWCHYNHTSTNTYYYQESVLRRNLTYPSLMVSTSMGRTSTRSRWTLTCTCPG